MAFKSICFNLALGTSLAATAVSVCFAESASVNNRSEQYSAATFYETLEFRISANDHVFSNNGDRLLVSADESGVFNAYEISMDDGVRRALTTSVEDAVTAVSFLPSGDGILYLADQGGDELDHLYLKRGDEAAIDLTPGERLKAGFVEWVRHGENFIVQTNERNSQFFDLYKYDSQTFERDLVFENKDSLGGFVVSPDGRFAAATRSNSSRDNDLFLIDLSTGDAKNLTPSEETATHRAFAFTPDSKSLIFGSDAGREFIAAYSLELTTGEAGKEPYVAADWDIMYVSFSPGGRYRVVGVNKDGRNAIEIHDLRKRENISTPKSLSGGQINRLVFSPTDDHAAVLYGSDRAPSDVYVFSPGADAAKRLSKALTTKIEPSDLVASETVRFPSTDDIEIPGILYKPKDASSKQRSPAIVLIHGGPGGQSRVGYSPIIQHLVNHGYGVFAVNNRGSSGYGKTFFHLDDRKHGVADLDDIVAARNYLAELGWVDSDKIAVMGGSYGGYLTMASLTFRPEVFDAGINIFGVTNWLRTLSSIPPWWGSFRTYLYDEMGDPETNAERLKAISPLFHAKNVVRPLLVVQGANDPRVLQVESDEIVAAVRANGVPVEYLLFPDEGHGFQSKDNRIAASEAYLAFLNCYLRDMKGACHDAP